MPQKSMTTRHQKMITSAKGAIQNIFNPKPSDKVLILTDTFSHNIAQAFSETCAQFHCSVDSYLIKNDMRPLIEIPAELEMLLQDKTIVLNILKSFPEEIPFRIRWIFKVKESNKIKMGHMPGITEEMMYNSVNVDFNKMKLTAEFLINTLNKAEQLHISTDEGTDIYLGISNRNFISDIGVKEGEMCNLPCGEIYTAPLETEADGVIVFNASIGDIGLLKSPLKVFVKKGRIKKFESDNDDLVKRITELTEVDEDAWMIGELGIGLNPGARITGNMLEDEKSLGTAHIAFGNNEDFPGGGKNKSKIHRDYLFNTPTIEIKYLNGHKKLLIQKGNITL